MLRFICCLASVVCHEKKRLCYELLCHGTSTIQFYMYLFLDCFNVVGENNKTNKWYKTKPVSEFW